MMLFGLALFALLGVTTLLLFFLSGFGFLKHFPAVPKRAAHITVLAMALMPLWGGAAHGGFVAGSNLVWIPCAAGFALSTWIFLQGCSHLDKIRPGIF